MTLRQIQALIGAILSLTLLPASFPQLQAQEGKRIGEWTAHVSFSRSRASAELDGLIYAISEGGMFSYDPATTEIRTFSTIEGLSGINPNAIYAVPEKNRLFIGYPNGQIDIFTPPGNFNYFTDIKRNTFFTDKGIATFVSSEDRMYIGTNFGLVIYDLNKGLPIADISLIANNPSQTKVTHIAVFEARIYLTLAGAGIFSAPVDHPNLKDPTAWTSENGVQGFPNTNKVRALGANSKTLYAVVDSTVMARNEGEDWAVDPFFDNYYVNIFVQDQGVGVPDKLSFKMKFSSGTVYNHYLGAFTKHLLFRNNEEIFISTEFRGLQKFFEWNTTQIVPNGPRDNTVTRLAAGDGEVYVAPLGYDGSFGPIPASGGIYYRDQQSSWTVKDSSDGSLPPAVSTGFARAWYDHKENEAWIGSWGAGLLRMKDGEVLDAFNCENSGLSSVKTGCDPTDIVNTRVSGIEKDHRGILWISQQFAINPLVFMQPDGQWFQIPQFQFPSDHQLLDLIVDDFGNKWIVNSKQGILIHNDRQTPEDFSDDKVVLVRKGLSTGNLPTDIVNTLARDQDGYIWVGTSQGVAVFFDPYSAAEGKLERAGAVTPVFDRRPLLKESNITSIAVDGGNRKWIGTSDGAFLVNEDGDEVILQFDKDNSPLFTNEIVDIEIDPQSGEVYIATALGLISYRGDATEGAANCDDVLVFPNPFFTNTQGPIVIRGSVKGSVVKITTISGQLVNELQAQGGTATWDGRDYTGRMVRSGVYLALIADNNGDNACVGKFTIIEQ